MQLEREGSVSGGKPVCPHCGEPLPAKRLSLGAELAICAVAIVVLLGAVNLVSGVGLFGSSLRTPLGTVTAR